MDSKTLLVKTLDNENKVKQKTTKGFSWVLFFAGEEFNQELEKIKSQRKIELIDFEKQSNRAGVWVEEEIKRICNDGENNRLITEKKFPIIWFKNLEKLTSGSELEKALLPIFDHQQNTELFSNKIDLSDYILVATSAIRDMGKLSLPLTSRLECINVETAQTRQFFLDKYFSFLLVGTVFSIVILLVYLFWPNKSKVVE
jgi:hypothetical protein